MSEKHEQVTEKEKGKKDRVGDQERGNKGQKMAVKAGINEKKTN